MVIFPKCFSTYWSKKERRISGQAGHIRDAYIKQEGEVS